VRVVALPGVFRPISDTWLLAGCLGEPAGPAGRVGPGTRVLEVGTGSGAIAATAARLGAEVTALDVSRRALWSARLTARLNGVRVSTRRGNLLDPVHGERFDLIVSNPPYVPAVDPDPPRGPARAWDAGPDGRVFVDRLCAQAGAHLRPGGRLLLVHSSVNGEQRTLEALREGGLDGAVVARRRGRLGPLLWTRRRLLETHALLATGASDEELLVICGTAG